MDDLACGRMCPPRRPAKEAGHIPACVVIPAQVSYNILYRLWHRNGEQHHDRKKRGAAFYRWRLFRQSRSRRLGGDPAVQGAGKGAFRRGADDHQQPHGAAGRTPPCRVILTRDSKYLVVAVTTGWVYGGQKKGWKKSDNSPALNVDLWERLLPLLKYHEVEFVWVKGHAGHPENERCDRLAVAWYQNY